MIISQDKKQLSAEEIFDFQKRKGFTSYILDIGEPSFFEKELIESGIECVLYEGMINGIYGKNLDKFGLKNKSNRIQAPFIQTSKGDNVVWKYKQELEQKYGREFSLESQILYDDFCLDILKRCSEETRIFSRELDTNGRFVNFNGQSRIPKKDDFRNFREYLEIIQRNSSDNTNIYLRKNYPQLSLDCLNMLVFVSQLREGSNKSGFLGGPVSNEYMPKGFRAMEKLYRNKILPNCKEILPINCELTLYDVSIGRNKNI